MRTCLVSLLTNIWHATITPAQVVQKLPGRKMHLLKYRNIWIWIIGVSHITVLYLAVFIITLSFCTFMLRQTVRSWKRLKKDRSVFYVMIRILLTNTCYVMIDLLLHDGKLFRDADSELYCFLWFAPEPTVEGTTETPVIWDATALIHDVSIVFAAHFIQFLPQDVAFSIHPVLPGAALRRNRCCQAPPCGETALYWYFS